MTLISQHLSEFGGFRIRDYEGDGKVHAGLALRIPSAAGSPYSGDKLPSLADVVEELGDAASRIQGLVFGIWSEEMYDEKPDAIVRDLLSNKDTLSNLQVLFIGDVTYEENEISWIQQTALGALPGAFPRLEWLGVRGGNGLSLAGMRSEQLKGLVVQSGGLPGSVLRELGEAELPGLEHLELWLGTEDYGGDSSPEDAAGLLSGRFPKLRTLALRNSQHTDAFVAAVVKAPVMETITRLDFSMGTLGVDGARALLACPHLDRLGSLDIGHHHLPDDLIRALKDRLGDRLLGWDRPDTNDHGEDEYYCEVRE